jgi:hypothetical protein
MDSPSATPKDNRKIWYATLIALLLATWGYIIYDKNQTKQVIAQKDTQFVNVTSAKDSLQLLFNAASARVDSITETNVQLQGSLAEKNSQILKLKSNIRGILNKKNATAEELKQAQEMITQLNGKIDELYTQITQLKNENQQLTTQNKGLQDSLSTSNTQNKNLQAENTNLNEKVDVASTLDAYNINVSAVNVKKSGKEKETSNVKRANLFIITGSLSSNRTTPSGKKEIYVVAYNPDGTVSGAQGTLTLRDGKSISYTNKIDVDYEQGKVTPLSFTWKPDGQVQTGRYKFEVYNNGFKIGEGQKDLKKTGFLGL